MWNYFENDDNIKQVRATATTDNLQQSLPNKMTFLSFFDKIKISKWFESTINHTVRFYYLLIFLLLLSQIRVHVFLLLWFKSIVINGHCHKKWVLHAQAQLCKAFYLMAIVAGNFYIWSFPQLVDLPLLVGKTQF